MTDREAMQMALEALQCSLPFHETVQRLGAHNKAITALRTKLEQPDRQALQAEGKHPAPCARHCEAKAFEIEIRGLKSALRAKLEQQAEPVAWMSQAGNFLSPLEFTTADAALYGWTPVYTTTPALQRKPLTDEEIQRLLPVNGSWFEFARAIEQAHGIKETP